MLIDEKQTWRRSKGQIEWNDKEQRSLPHNYGCIVKVNIPHWLKALKQAACLGFFYASMKNCCYGSSEVTCPSWLYSSLFNNIPGHVSMTFQKSYKVMETIMHERPWKLRLMKTVMAQQLLWWIRLHYFYEWLAEQFLAASCSSSSLSPRPLLDMTSFLRRFPWYQYDKGWTFSCNSAC